MRAGEAMPEERARFQELHLAASYRVLALDSDELYRVAPFDEAPPRKARLHASVPCASCGEETVETRLHLRGRDLCRDCFERELFAS